MELEIVAKEIFTMAVNVFGDDIKDATMNAARDGFESLITGKRTMDEWAKIAIKGVDKIKEHAIKEDGLRFIGGNLKFALSDKKRGKVIISFELFCLDVNEKWRKIGAESDLNASNFTPEALDEITIKGEILYEVE